MKEIKCGNCGGGEAESMFHMGASGWLCEKCHDKVFPANCTLRDQFAMAALTGMVGDAWLAIDTEERFGADANYLKVYAKQAYEFADAMLEARE